jgi:hypothetical protein
MVRVLDIEAWPEELVCCAIGTELASTGGIRVGEITASSGYVILHIVPARLAGRRFQGHQLNGCASNIVFPNGWCRKVSQR